MSEDLYEAVDRYLVAASEADDAITRAALVAARAAGLPPIDVSPNQGKLLMLLAKLARAERILEVGTLGGYSTIWLARALPAAGTLVTLELDPRHARVARANLAHAGFAERVEVIEGPALESLRNLRAAGGAPFDFTFIDADKINTPAYFDYAVAMSRPGAAIVVDNAVRGGAILDARGDSGAEGMRAFFESLAGRRDVSVSAVQTVGSKGHDGFALALVTGSGA